MIERRAVVLAGAAALAAWPLAACTTGSSAGPEPTPTGADDPDLALRATVAAAETGLIAAYDATIAAHPSLVTRLRSFRDQHAQHRAAVAPADAGVPSASATAVPVVPSRPEAALAALAALERSAAGARATDAGAAARWQLARLLSLVGGSEAAHHALLSSP